MTPAGAFINTLMRTYDFVDREFYDEPRAEKRQERQDQEQRQYRQHQMGLQTRAAERADEQVGLQQERFDWQKNRAETADERADTRLESDLDYREHQMGLQENQEQRAQESHETQQAETERKRKEEKVARAIHAAYQASRRGEPVSPQIMQEYEELTGNSLYEMAQPEFLAAGEKLAEAAQGGLPELNKPESLEALNTVYERRIKRTVGAKTKDGKKITDVRITGVVPGKKPGTVAFAVDVDYEGEQESGRRRPLTENRSDADDDDVMQVDIGTAIDSLGARVEMSRIVQSDPQWQAAIRQSYEAQTGKTAGTKEGSYTITDGYLLDKDTGEYKQLPGGGGKDSAKMQAANRLMQEGGVDNFTEAWRQANLAADNPEKWMRDYVLKMTQAAAEGLDPDAQKSPQEWMAEARLIVQMARGEAPEQSGRPDQQPGQPAATDDPLGILD